MTTVSERRVERYQFSKEITDEVHRCYRTDNWHGLVMVAKHWLVIALWVGLSHLAFGRLGLALAAPVYVLAVFSIGGRQRALAGVLHEACHGTLMANKRCATAIGAFLAGYPVLQSFSGYRATHVFGHHRHFGDTARDPDYVQYQKLDLCGGNLSQSSLRRYLRHLVGIRSTFMYIHSLLRYRILSREEAVTERCLRVAFVTAVGSLCALYGWLGMLGLYWLIPLITTQVWIGSIAELSEHYPMIETATPRIDIDMSWNRYYPRYWRVLLGEAEGEGYHLVHHLFPRVPLWRLREVNEILRADAVYASRPVLRGGARAVVRGVLRCLPTTALAD